MSSSGLKYSFKIGAITFALLLLLGGCAPSIKKMDRYLNGELNTSLPDSLRADISLLVESQGKLELINSIVFAVPQSRYRMELNGPLGVTLASILWLPENWTMLIPSEGLYHVSKGDYMKIPGTILPPINVHQTLGVLWGELLPLGWTKSAKLDQGDSLRILNWEKEGAKYNAIIELKTGQVRSVTIQGELNEEIQYSRYKLFDGRMIPSRIDIYREGVRIIRMSVSDVKTDAVWRSSVWRIKIPEDFKAIP
jgi:hypothetical protein